MTPPLSIGRWFWGIFPQAEMGSRRVIIKCICNQNAAKMRLAPDNDVVETFPPDRADYPLNVTVLPVVIVEQ